MYDIWTKKASVLSPELIYTFTIHILEMGSKKHKKHKSDKRDRYEGKCLQ
jgi:hypothetical protein